jgi:hypothetical protein
MVSWNPGTPNNHAQWYDVQAVDCALFSGEREAARQIALVCTWRRARFEPADPRQRQVAVLIAHGSPTE